LKTAREIPRQPQRTIQGAELVTEIGIWHAPDSAQGVSLQIQPLYQRLNVDPPTLRSRTNQLILRGLIMPDTGTRIDSHDFLTFAFGNESVMFEDLLIRAGSLDDLESDEQ
jgi:hypothetical protein